MFLKERNNSLLIANRMTTMGIMPARELTPKDFLALIAFLMNFSLAVKEQGQSTWIPVHGRPTRDTLGFD